MNRLLSAVAAAALIVAPVYTQNRAADSKKQVKAGDVIQLTDGVTVKVIKASQSPFAAVKVKGEPIVVVIEIDAGKKSAKLGYKLSTNAGASDFYLASGEQKFGPRAVIEDFPSWGGDNDKEVEVLDQTAEGTSLSFQGKGSLSLLFDVPAEQAKTQKKLSITIKTVNPSVEDHSFIVTM